MRRLFFLSMLLVAAPVAMGVGACDGDDTATAPSSPNNLDDVVYEGGTTDEALIALLSAHPQSDPEQAVVFSNPSDGATLPGDQAPKFGWHLGGAMGSLAPAARPGAQAGKRSFVSGWSVLRGLLGGIPAARAHGAPINGRGYLLVFSTARQENVLRVFTTKLDYTPDAGAWAKLRSAGEPITVSALNAVFENNRVVQGVPPYEGVPVTFQITP